MGWRHPDWPSWTSQIAAHFEECSMEYEWEAASEVALLAHLTARCLPKGYNFVVQGTLPEGKDPAKTINHLVKKHQLWLCSDDSRRVRRKRQGLANLLLFGFERDWFLIFTPGTHWIWNPPRPGGRGGEKGHIIDIRRRVPKNEPHEADFQRPLIFRRRYELSLVTGADGSRHCRVRIERGRREALEAWFLDRAVRASQEELYWQFQNLNYEPYQRVHSQLTDILYQVNARRKTHGLKMIPTSAIRTWRRQPKLFAPDEREPAQFDVSDEELAEYMGATRIRKRAA